MDKKVLVYSTPTCSHCIGTKEFLKANNIIFEDIDVSANTEKGEEMVERSGQMGVPVIDIDGKLIIGFDQQAIKEALGIQ